MRKLEGALIVMEIRGNPKTKKGPRNNRGLKACGVLKTIYFQKDIKGIMERLGMMDAILVVVLMGKKQRNCVLLWHVLEVTFSKLQILMNHELMNYQGLTA